MRKSIQAIIFDLDNTIYPEVKYFNLVVNSLPPEHFSIDEKKTILQNFKKLRLRSKDIIGDCLELIGRNTKKDHDIFFEKYSKPAMDKISIDFDTEHTLKKLHLMKFKLGLLTNGIIKVQQAKIDRLNISHLFDEVIFARSWGYSFEKPHKKAFEMAKNALEVEWDEVAFVGDNPKTDFKVPNSNGSLTIRLMEGVYKDLSSRGDVDFEIENIRSVIKII